MRFAFQSLVIVSILGLFASTSAKPTHLLRKGHDKQTVSTKSLRQFDPRKAPTRRAFGAAPHRSHIPTDRFNGFWEYDETSERDDTGYVYDVSGNSGNTLRSGPDDTQHSNANTYIPMGTTSSAVADPDVLGASQNAGTRGSSSRSASGLLGNFFPKGMARGSSPSSPNAAKTMSTVDGLGSASPLSPTVSDAVATAPSWANRHPSLGISSPQSVRSGPSLAQIPADNEHPSRSEPLRAISNVAPKLPTSGSSISPNSISNTGSFHPTVKMTSRPLPHTSPETGDRIDRTVVGV